MRGTLFTMAAVVSATLALGSPMLAQSVPGPTIHSVTLSEGSGVLTINGTGFGRDPVVTVDGQPAVVLQGGSDTQLGVLSPAALLTTPGTYRLTVVDPVRHVGDAFVVATQTATVVSAGLDLPGTPGAASGAVMPSGLPAVGLASPTASLSAGGPSPQTVIEDSDFPYRTAIGFEALVSNTAGHSSTAIGFEALFSNTTGYYNTASGFRALRSNTTGFANTASGDRALINNTTGAGNTASGSQALISNTTGGSNTASGVSALLSNTTGEENTASGVSSLFSNTTGELNTASGVAALYRNTTGYRNTAIGTFGLFNNTTGSRNTAIGYNAGRDATTGSYNLFLGAGVFGAAADTNTIRIGFAGGQNKTFIAGIRGTTTVNPDAIAVMIDSAGQLGTVSSSRRFKEDIQDMADASAGILRLRPVTFRYTQAIAGGAKPRQYGLIAEEVAEVYPDLVVHAADGQVETVQYDKVNSMLLNEVQKQHRELAAQAEQIRALTEQLTVLATRLQGVEAQRLSTRGR